MNLRIITCDIKDCQTRYEEVRTGAGFPGWGQLNGIVLNDIPNPSLCPKHLAQIAAFVDNLEVA